MLQRAGNPCRANMCERHEAGEHNDPLLGGDITKGLNRIPGHRRVMRHLTQRRDRAIINHMTKYPADAF